MAISQANVIVSIDTFNDWVTKTNQMAANMSVSVVTANTSLGLTTGNCYVNGYFSANNVYVGNNISGGLNGGNNILNIANGVTISNSSATFIAGQVSFATTTAYQLVDQYLLSTSRSSKYLLQIDTAVGFQSTEVMVLHDGTNSFLTEYATLGSNSLIATLGTFVANVNGLYMQLLVSPTQNNSNVIFQRTSLTV